MKIISQFKDYYDYISGQYGIDPSIVYNRNKITEKHLGNQYSYKIVLNNLYVTVPFSIKSLPKNIKIGNTNYTFSWLVFTGKYYLVVNARSTLNPLESSVEIFNSEKHSFLSDHLLKNNLFFANWRNRDLTGYLANPDSNLDKISQFLNSPVYLITGSHKIVEISTKIPVLKDLGFPSLKEPSQAFQEIYSYLQNVLRESPDLAPPVLISDSDKIVQHGFDIKKSFRHPKGN